MYRSSAVVRLGYLLVVGLLAAACAAPSAASLSGLASAGAQVTRGALAPSPSADAARQGAAQEVRLPGIEPPTLDPGLAQDLASIDVIIQMFDGLVALDAAGGHQGVGASSWTISADGLTYTFTLRQGVLWSDGKPVTAHDYAWAWKRNVSPVTASPYANAFFPIKNGQAINDGELDPEQLGVQATDDRTLVVTLERPAAFFLSLASTVTLYPLRQDIVEGYGDRWTEAANIVTNGAYTLTWWQHDTRIVLERNERYWGSRPAVTRATFQLFPEDGVEQILAAYEAGEIDTTGSASGIPASQLDRIMADPVLGQEIRTFKQSGTYFFVVNHRKPHFQDARVRKAIGIALNRRQLLDDVIKQAGDPASGIQPEGILGRQPAAWPQEDAAAAQQLMADAGYPNGQGFPEITLTYATTATNRLLAEYTQQQLKDVLGITVKLESMESAVFLRWRRSSDWERSGDLYRASWFSDYEDPENWYNHIWDSESDPGVYNAGWKNAQFDGLVRQALMETDAARRTALYSQADQVMAQDYPHIPLYHEEVRALVKPYLKGYTPGRVPAVAPIRAMSVDPR
jgi:oligopeptide transport system substrate-binding protein